MFARDWSLTAGVRYDNYSDFGDTINPRAAIIWQTAFDLTTKLLYGRAFRAPSFAELYNINNPVALGNANLEPETIDTIELAFDYQISGKARSGLNLFHYKMRDIIRPINDPAPATTVTAQNSGSQSGYGLEWEVSWNITDTVRLIGNYALQRSEDDNTGSDPGNAPHHKIYARVNWRPLNSWNISPQITWVGERQRVSADSRPPVDDYLTIDLTVRRTQDINKFALAASIRNLLDETGYEPSLSPGQIPNDLPIAGRNFYVEAQYFF